MAPRIIVHAGFHKTGTTTVQKTLRAHRDTLRGNLRIVLRPGMIALCEAARAYSVSRSQTDLGLLRYEAASLAEGWQGRRKPVLLSSEDLAGHMPGRRGLTAYDATPRIMQAMTQAVHAALPDAAVHIHFSTRAAVPWLQSCYVQHLRATRITEDMQTYVDTARTSADLTAIVDQTRDLVRAASVTATALEDCADMPLGPLTPLLDLAQISGDGITLLPPANTAPPQAKIDALLALNRSDLNDADWRAAKDALNRRTF